MRQPFIIRLKVFKFFFRDISQCCKYNGKSVSGVSEDGNPSRGRLGRGSNDLGRESKGRSHAKRKCGINQLTNRRNEL